ncbi:hypothetical protein [Streptomyces sp. MK37H]|nr:hypothetical protein [Streptomyces sp. MK37H]
MGATGHTGQADVTLTEWQDAKITAVTYQMDSLLQTDGAHTGRWSLRA